MNNKIFIGIIGLIFVIFISAAILIKPTSTAPAEIGEIAGVKTYEIEDRNHTQESVDYAQSPPVGGNHFPVWLGCNRAVYDDPVENEKAVHALEHGAVWITYNDQLSDDQKTQVSDQVKDAFFTFMSPYPGQDSPLVLTAWNTQLELDSAEDPRFNDFLNKYRQGEQTPEPGATCDAPAGA